LIPTNFCNSPKQISPQLASLLNHNTKKKLLKIA